MFYLFLSKRVWNTFQWHTFPLPYSMLYDWPQCLWALRNDPTMSRGEGAGAQGTSKHLFLGKCQNSFARRLQVNTAYPKRTRRHTLPSRCINFKDKKSLIFDFVLSLSLSQLRAIARRHVSYRQKHQYRFFFHWGFHEDRFWVHYFFEFTSMICHFLYKILKLIRMPTTLPWGSTIWSSGNACESIQQSLQESLHNANCWFSFNGMKRNVKKQCKSKLELLKSFVVQNSLELGSTNISLRIRILIILLASWTAELACSKSEIWTAGNYCIIPSQLLNTTLRYGATVLRNSWTYFYDYRNAAPGWY